MPSLGIGVVAHQQRRTMAQHLADAVHADVLHEDDGQLGCEANHVRVLRALWQHSNRWQWYIMLEDDAVVVPEFRKHASAALAHAQADIVSLYLGTGHNPPVQREIQLALDNADAAGAGWIVADALMFGVAYALHHSIVEQLLAAIDNPADPNELPLRITRWAQRHSADIDYTVPSLANHQDGWSTIAQTELLGRIAHRHGTREHWDTGAVHMSVPGWSLA